LPPRRACGDSVWCAHCSQPRHVRAQTTARAAPGNFAKNVYASQCTPCTQNLSATRWARIKAPQSSRKGTVNTVVYSAKMGWTYKNTPRLRALQLAAGFALANLLLAGCITFLGGCVLMRGTICTGGNLAKANLAGIDLHWADLTGSDLSGANLSGADLEGIVLLNANLAGANLSNANLRSADLRNADLTNANVTGANFLRADLQNARTTGANLQDANLQEAIMPNGTMNP